MKTHYIQHVPFEDLAGIEPWLIEKDHSVSCTKTFNNEPFPEIDQFDLLIIMGGPMSVNDEKKFPWLYDEKIFIENAIKKGKLVLGICLGAQLIADVLGAKIYKNKHKEIGWFPVTLTEEAEKSKIFNKFPHTFTPFHWHGDMFEIPSGAVKIARSEACRSQAFTMGDNITGLQFHIESTEESIKKLIRHASHEIVAGDYIQNSEEMLSGSKPKIEKIHSLLDTMLKNFLI